MNIFLINILTVIFCLVLGYFFGSIPTAVWVGKIFFHQDPRDYGSHNAGGTNAGRLWGKKVGFFIILFDMFKTVIPVYICWLLFTFIKFNFSGVAGVADGTRALMPMALDLYTPAANDYAIRWGVYWLAAVGVILGHCWPIFAGFKGGKGAACFMGTTVVSSWLLGFLPGFFYLGMLKWKKWVSFAAIMQAIFVSIICWVWVLLVMVGPLKDAGYWRVFPMYGPSLFPDWTYAAVITFLGGLTIIRHHANIGRILNGTERKITWMK